MISVEQVIQELRRIQGEIPSCVVQCRQCYSCAEIAADSLGVFGGDARSASACLAGAASSLSYAQAALEQLDSSIDSAISELSK